MPPALRSSFPNATILFPSFPKLVQMLAQWARRWLISHPSISSMPGNTVPAVFAIPAANRPGFTGHFIPTPPRPTGTRPGMSYAGENEPPASGLIRETSLIPHNFTCLTHFREKMNVRLRLSVLLFQAPSHQPGVES